MDAQTEKSGGKVMPYTKASGQAVNRYSKKAYDDVRVRVKKGQKELIKKRAEELNKSVNSYIVDLIEQDMKDSKYSRDVEWSKHLEESAKHYLKTWLWDFYKRIMVCDVIKKQRDSTYMVQ